MFTFRSVTLYLCAIALVLACGARPASANAVSITGTLATPESTFTLVFHVSGSSAQTIDFQTWSFGGGVNANGQTIPSGGFDPQLVLFSGLGPGATFINGTSDVSSNFGSFMGCPPAGTVVFSNGDDVCGDINMSLALTAGNYTLVLSDAAFISNALNAGSGTLGDGFTNLVPLDSNGNPVFQTCDINLNNGITACINPSANFAFDVTDTGNGSVTPGPTPEPASLLLLGTGILGIGWFARKRNFGLRAARIRIRS